MAGDLGVLGTRHGYGWWLVQGAVGGIVAGVAFVAFEMASAWLLTGAVWTPLRMIGAIGLGPAALDPGYPLATAAAVGLVVHAALSVGFGALFGAVPASVPAVARSSGALLAAASAYGFALWAVNFHVLAPLFGWGWFPDRTNAPQQFLAHTVFFGTVLGFYLDRARDGARPDAD
jgi:hypothetical protein